MLSVVGLVLSVVIMSVPALQSVVQPRRPGQEAFVTRALFADGRLWLLSDAGVLSTITEGKDTRVEEALPEPVLDVCLLGGQPAIVTCDPKDLTTWTVRRWASGKWSVGATVPTQGDDLVALFCTNDQATILTSRRLVELGRDPATELALNGDLGPGLVASVLGAQDSILIGINAGEWGGGLRRIDRKSGKVTVIEAKEAGGLCKGVLNTSCDPVNGIAFEPWNPECVAAAIGLVHMRPHGRIVEVCGDSVKRLYFKPWGEASSTASWAEDEPFETVAFFGLVSQGESLWAAGIDGIYRIEAGGAVSCTPLPTFKTVGEIDVSFELPHLVLLLTDVNQRRSVSGRVPMLVPR